MAGILVHSRRVVAAGRQRPQRAPRVVPNFADPPAAKVISSPRTPVGLSNAAGEASRRIQAGAPLSIGSLLYLGSVGLIAAGIVAVFFGAGFSLLVRTADGTIAGSADRAGPEITPRPPSLGNVEQQTFFGQASARENKDAAQSSAAFPAPTGAPAIDGKEDVPQSGGGLTSKAPTDTPSAPANAPVPAPSSPAPPTSGLSTAEITDLSDHGDSLLRNGDFASARLFYERAADAGDGRAALRLGATFDPAFLSRLGLGKLQANPAEARSWYSRAVDLGAVDAKSQLNSLATKTGK